MNPFDFELFDIKQSLSIVLCIWVQYQIREGAKHGASPPLAQWAGGPGLIAKFLLEASSVERIINRDTEK